MGYEFKALSSELCEGWRAGGLDANGQSPERAVSDGGGNPCRHCLRDIPQGKEMLILAHRPFKTLNPYAEVGPVFICAECQRRDDSADLPPVVSVRKQHLLKGYLPGDRIAYGTGAIVGTAAIPDTINLIFRGADIAYIDVRSASNNCFTVRVHRQNS